MDRVYVMMEFLSAKGVATGDLGLLALLFIVWPLLGSLTMMRNPPHETEYTEADRLETYNYTLLSLWLTASVILIWWIAAGRSAAELGFQYTVNTPTLAVTGLVALILLYNAVELLRTAASEKERKKLRDLLSTLKHAEQLIPTTKAEFRSSMAVSLTAGITEEIIFRGYLIWVLSLLMHPWAAGTVSALLFIFLHRYQGLKGMAQVAVITGVVTALYLACGSLWPVIVLHILFDVFTVARLWLSVKDAPEREAA